MIRRRRAHPASLAEVPAEDQPPILSEHLRRGVEGSGSKTVLDAEDVREREERLMQMWAEEKAQDLSAGDRQPPPDSTATDS